MKSFGLVFTKSDQFIIYKEEDDEERWKDDEEGDSPMEENHQMLTNSEMEVPFDDSESLWSCEDNFPEDEDDDSMTINQHFDKFNINN
jgi:hypothetical protein